MTNIKQEHEGLAPLDTSTEAVEALLKGLPPEPWEENWNRVFDAEAVMVCSASGNRNAKNICYFIAAARELVPALLAERDALKTALADARDMRRILALIGKGESHE